MDGLPQKEVTKKKNDELIRYIMDE